jgi:hypothetical protein
LGGVKKTVVVSELFVGKELEKGKIAGVKIFAGGSLVREGVMKRNWVLSKTTWGVTYTCLVRGSRHKYPLLWKATPKKNTPKRSVLQLVTVVRTNEWITQTTKHSERLVLMNFVKESVIG